jgi:hypothetical protein
MTATPWGAAGAALKLLSGVGAAVGQARCMKWYSVASGEVLQGNVKKSNVGGVGAQY